MKNFSKFVSPLLDRSFHSETNAFLPPLDIVFMRATADFNEKNIGVQSKRINGRVLNTGQIIFSWLDGSDRKMVLTSNTGQPIKDGYLEASSNTWVNPDTWKSKDSGSYSISNFQPRQGYYYFFLYHLLSTETSVL